MTSNFHRELVNSINFKWCHFKTELFLIKRKEK
jgi:hypothetical protein